MNDFSLQAIENGAEDFLVLLVLGALVYFSVGYVRQQGGIWPMVLGWASVGALVIHAIRTASGFVQERLRSGSPSREMPDVPLSYESLDLLGGATTFLFGLAFFACGVALIFVGWNEGAGQKSRGKGRKRKSARRS